MPRPCSCCCPRRSCPRLPRDSSGWIAGFQSRGPRLRRCQPIATELVFKTGKQLAKGEGHLGTALGVTEIRALGSQVSFPATAPTSGCTGQSRGAGGPMARPQPRPPESRRGVGHGSVLGSSCSLAGGTCERGHLDSERWWACLFWGLPRTTRCQPVGGTVVRESWPRAGPSRGQLVCRPPLQLYLPLPVSQTPSP